MQARKSNDAVFLWIPKTAGTSIQTALSCPMLNSTDLVRYRFPQKGAVTFGHMSYLQLVEAGYVSRSYHESAFKFCFVRNPYDRAVSLFHYLKKRPRLDPGLSFVAFCRKLRDGEFAPIGLYNDIGLSQCNAQARWLDSIDVDFIGRYESLEADFATLLTLLGLPPTHIPRTNATHHQPYSHYYCDESRAIIADVYDEDFRSFGYSTAFDGSSGP